MNGWLLRALSIRRLMDEKNQCGGLSTSLRSGRDDGFWMRREQ